MALEKINVVDEFLARRQDDGSYAFHQRRLHSIREDGKLLPEHTAYGPVTAVEPEAVPEIMRELNLGVIAERDEHRAARRAAEIEREQHSQARACAHAERDEARKELAEAHKAHNENAAALSARQGALRRQLEKVTLERDAAFAKLAELGFGKSVDEGGEASGG